MFWYEVSWYSTIFDSSSVFKVLKFPLKGLLHALAQVFLTAQMQVPVERTPKTTDPKVKGSQRWRKVRNKCMSVCMCVRKSICVSACVSEWVSELLGCIGILKCDWQGRSLLGEIVNRIEPVICSRQPWKGMANSQGSYWEFQRCCLTDLGLGPRHTEPEIWACSRIHADQCTFTFSLLCSDSFSRFLNKFLLFQAVWASFCFYFANFAFFLTLWNKLCLFFCTAFLQYNRNLSYTKHNLIGTIKHTVETTSQTTLLHRRVQKQIKLADLLTLYSKSHPCFICMHILYPFCLYVASEH